MKKWYPCVMSVFILACSANYANSAEKSDPTEGLEIMDAVMEKMASKPFNISYKELVKYHKDCDNADKAMNGRMECASAAGRYCRALKQGFAGGIPEETTKEVMTVLCIK